MFDNIACLQYIVLLVCVFHFFIDSAVLFNPTGQTNEVFQWMAKEHLCILVYLVTVYHSVQAGYIEKAQKYSEKALSQIQALKGLRDLRIKHYSFFF